MVSTEPNDPFERELEDLVTQKGITDGDIWDLKDGKINDRSKALDEFLRRNHMPLWKIDGPMQRIRRRAAAALAAQTAGPAKAPTVEVPAPRSEMVEEANRIELGIDDVADALGRLTVMKSLREADAYAASYERSTSVFMRQLAQTIRACIEEYQTNMGECAKLLHKVIVGLRISKPAEYVAYSRRILNPAAKLDATLMPVVKKNKLLQGTVERMEAPARQLLAYCNRSPEDQNADQLLTSISSVLAAHGSRPLTQ